MSGKSEGKIEGMDAHIHGYCRSFLLRLHSYRYGLSTGMKSSLPWKYTTTMQSPPSSHLSSWTCPAGCDHMDPGPPVSGAAPLNVCVNLPWTPTPSSAALCQSLHAPMPPG